MIEIEKIKRDIIKALKPLDPKDIILFGSYAYGVPREDSDIDLYIVTKDHYIPENYNQKIKLYLKYSKKIRKIRSVIALDLIVHTQGMRNIFFKQKNQIVEDINKGIKLV